MDFTINELTIIRRALTNRLNEVGEMIGLYQEGVKLFRRNGNTEDAARYNAAVELLEDSALAICAVLAKVELFIDKEGA